MNVRITTLFIFSLLFWAFSAQVAVAAPLPVCDAGARNLKLGMEGADVKALQQFLNTNTVTMVAQEGLGSPGFETAYFGKRTMLAVIKFQELHKKEILTPVGLTRGSGFVGRLSLAMIMTICNKVVDALPVSNAAPTATVTDTLFQDMMQPSATDTPMATALTSTFFASNQPTIMFLSEYAALRGATVTIAALGLASSGNDIHLDDFVIRTGVLGSDGGLSFVVPTDAPLGKHTFWVSSAKGETNKTFFVVADQHAVPPSISSITPEEGFMETMVTVTGSGFLPEGNDIHISYGTIQNVASPDGKTLQFKVSPPLFELELEAYSPEFDTKDPQWFYVVNNNGLSDTAIFTLHI